MRFDLIQSIYEQCTETLGSSDFEMVIASSLSVLNEDMLQWSRGRNITFSVSLDGEEVVHNSNRILGHGLAYSRTVSGVEAIKRSLGAGRVATVTTVTKDLIRHPESIVGLTCLLASRTCLSDLLVPMGLHKSIVHIFYGGILQFLCLVDR